MEAPVGSPAEWQAIIVSFLRDHLRRSGASGFHVGMSGGLDSAVAAALAVQAVGPDHVVGVMMPAPDSDPSDQAHAQAVCDHLGIAAELRGIGPITDGLQTIVPELETPVLGNGKARARMMVLYAMAQSVGHLVLGTGNKSEILIGYFTKFGDGGNDLQPIGDLYKTQVRELARHLGLPGDVIEKPPSAGLWAGQTDEEELGLSYESLDAILKGIELNAGIDEIATRTGIKREEVARIEAMVRRSEHKRRPSVIPKIGARTVGIDWRRPVHWDA